MDTFALQKSIVSKAKRIDAQESLRLLQMFMKNGIKFTENMNGCFIDLIDVDAKFLMEVQDFLDMCIEVHTKNDERNAQIKQYAQEFAEQHYVPLRSDNVKSSGQSKETEFLNAIKNDRNLNSLEKSIMKENLKFSLVEANNSDKTRKSITPKYSGLKARLLKNCRMATRNMPAFIANSSGNVADITDKSAAKKPIDDDEDLDADIEGEIDDLQDIDADDDIENAEDES